MAENGTAWATVLGLGNPLYADDGLGLTFVQQFVSPFAGVEVIDGGTQGLYLLPLVQAARRLIVVDALDFGAKAGTVIILDGEAIPRALGQHCLSPHQASFSDVLALAELLDSLPPDMMVFGTQIGDAKTFGGSLTPEVAASLPGLERLVTAQLTRWRQATGP